jgi:hypothetical protein
MNTRSLPAFLLSPPSLLAALFLLSATRLHPCTLWGAAGETAGGGTLISKNRDWKPDHTQVLKMRRSTTGYAYFGLYAEGNNEPGLKSGVNEKGLTVVTASASSIPKEQQANQPGKRGALSTLLTKFATCDEIVAKQAEIFPMTRAAFFLIADARKLLVVEVGLNGKYALRTVERGPVVHTNYYLERSLAEFNVKIGRSSQTRFNRISELTASPAAEFTMDTFARISRDRNAGPDNSLWRTGNGKNERTMSSWIVETPAQSAPRLRVLLANPGQPEETRTYVLDEKFWRTAK